MSHTTLSHTHCHTHTPLSKTQLCHIHIVTHTHTFVTHTQLCHTHTTLSHTNCHIQLCHTHTQLCHIQIATYKLSHTNCHIQLCHTHTQLCHTHTQLCHTHTTLRGRRDTWWHRALFCVAGVALGDIHLRCVAGVALLGLGWVWWRAWGSLVARDAAALLRGRRGAWWHPPSFHVASVALASFHVASVALGDIHLRFLWQAWHLATLTFVLRGRHCSWRHPPSFCLAHTTLPHTHTSLSHTTLSHPSHTQLCHTPSFTHRLCHTHNLSHASLSHAIFHTPSLSHTTFTHHLCHTPSVAPSVTHTQLCHTPSFTHNFVTHHLSHTSWLHTIFHTHLCHTPSCMHDVVTHHLCHTPSFTHISVTHHLSHTTLVHTTLHIQPFLTHRSSTTSLVYPACPIPLQLCVLIIGRNWLAGLSGPLISPAHVVETSDLRMYCWIWDMFVDVIDHPTKDVAGSVSTGNSWARFFSSRWVAFFLADVSIFVHVGISLIGFTFWFEFGYGSKTSAPQFAPSAHPLIPKDRILRMDGFVWFCTDQFWKKKHAQFMLNSYIQYIPMRRPYGFLGLYIKYSNDIPMIRPYDIRIPWTWPMTSQKKNLDDLAGHLPAAWKTSSRRGRSHPLRASGCGGRGAHRICVPWKIGDLRGLFWPFWDVLSMAMKFSGSQLIPNCQTNPLWSPHGFSWFGMIEEWTKCHVSMMSTAPQDGRDVVGDGSNGSNGSNGPNGPNGSWRQSELSQSLGRLWVGQISRDIQRRGHGMVASPVESRASAKIFLQQNLLPSHAFILILSWAQDIYL